MGLQRRCYRPCAEVLEDRAVPAIFTQVFDRNVNIPDGPSGAWVGWDVDARSLPAGAVVNSITVRHVVAHKRVGDLEVKLDDDSAATGTWTIRDNVGGNQKNFDETRFDNTTFVGASAQQVFHYRIRDTMKGDKGTLDKLVVTIDYSVLSSVQIVATTLSIFQNGTWVETTQARDGQTVRLGYQLSNTTGAAVATTLDGTMTDSAGRILRDAYRETTVSVAPGTDWYYREYWVNTPPSPSAGAYDVGYEIRPSGAATQSVTLQDAFTVLAPIEVRVPILMYHHVDNNPVGSPSSDGGVYPEVLREQLFALKSNGYTFITYTELMEMRAGDRAIPAKPVMLTFDDGYDDFLTNALPILQEVGAKATAYIFTEMVDSAILSWEQLQTVQSSGLVDIQGHTVSHPHLTRLSDEELTAELVDSKAALESHLGKEIRYMSYPFGDYDARVMQAAWQAGYGSSVKAWGGLESTSANKWELNRISVVRSTTADQLLAMIA